MLVCCGPDKRPISTLDKDVCDESQLFGLCSAISENGTTVYLEYHPNLYLTLSSPAIIQAACEMVAGYHNHLKKYMAPSMWGGGSGDGLMYFTPTLDMCDMDDPDSDANSAGNVDYCCNGSMDVASVVEAMADTVPFSSRLRKYMPKPMTPAVVGGVI